MPKHYNTRNRSLDAEINRKRSRFNRSKAQSGAFAEARLAALQPGRRKREADPSLLERETRRAERQLKCARGRMYDVVRHEDGSLEERIVGGWSCNVPTCQPCNERRAVKLFKRVVEAHARAVQRVTGVQVLDLVLTMPSKPVAELGRQIDLLHKAIRDLFRTTPFTRAFLGSFRRTEVTYNADSGTAHPHAHVLLYARPLYFDSKLYLPQPQIQALWAKQLGIGTFVNVSIRKVAGDDDWLTLRRSILHAAKYAVKPLNLYTAADVSDAGDVTYAIPPDLAEAFARGLYRKRMTAFAGIMRSNWKLPPSF